MEIIQRNSQELSTDDKAQICDLFRRVFGKEMRIEDFSLKFEQAINGYSYHGLMKDNGLIVGCYSVIPYEYRVKDKSYIFGLSVDTMIDENYRGNPFNLKKLAQLVYDKLIEDGVPFIFGFPNENVYLVRKKILKWRDIGQLDYYLLPIKIDSFKKNLKLLNPLWVGVCKILNTFISKTGNSDVQFNIQKIVNDRFNSQRYSKDYIHKDLPDYGRYTYRIHKEENIRVAYIIDALPLSKRTVEMAVKDISLNERDRADAVAFVGKLPFRPVNLIKIPRRFEPKSIRMAGKILIPNAIDESLVFNINEWNVNLSNFDVR